MVKSSDVIVVGACIAGVSAVKAIRGINGSTDITLISNEDRIPYKRTKISKNIASGFQTDDFQLMPKQWYDDNHIKLIYDTVKSIDLKEKILNLKSGEVYRFNKLLLATGAEPLCPQVFSPIKNEIFFIRRAIDAELLSKKAHQGKKAVIIGAGVEGVEIAEQLHMKNCDVTIIEKEKHVMGKQLNRHLSNTLQKLIEKKGIKILFNENITEIKATDSGHKLKLKHQEIYADIIIVCIGVDPGTELAQKAGLKVGKGIIVNNYLQSRHPDIYAAGDVAEHPEGEISELWHAAELQGKVAGQNIAGKQVAYTKPLFRLKCEVFGNYFFSINKPNDEFAFEGLQKEIFFDNEYFCFYFRNEKLIGMVMLNDKENAKIYELAVREQWDIDKVYSSLNVF